MIVNFRPVFKNKIVILICYPRCKRMVKKNQLTLLTLLYILLIQYTVCCFSFIKLFVSFIVILISTHYIWNDEEWEVCFIHFLFCNWRILSFSFKWKSIINSFCSENNSSTLTDKLLCILSKVKKHLKTNLLKGPKHEIFESGFFTQIRPVRLDDLGTGEKIWHFASWSLCLKVFATNIFFSVCSACA